MIRRPACGYQRNFLSLRDALKVSPEVLRVVNDIPTLFGAEDAVHQQG